MAENLSSHLTTLVEKDATPAPAFCNAMKQILLTLFPTASGRPKTGAELDFYFGHRVFRKVVHIPCVWFRPTLLDVDMPILAYINRSQLAAIRKALYSAPGRSENNTSQPVLRLQQLRSKLLIPSDANHDPYIVPVFLAMAQAHFYHGSSSPLSFRDIKLQVITHDEGNNSSPNFIIYTAVVTATFLYRFMFPHKAPKSRDMSRAGIDISYTPVCFWPVLGLKERLSKVLGREIAGESIYNDPNQIRLWDALVKPPHPASVRPKRRRTGTQLLQEDLPDALEPQPAGKRRYPAVPSAAKRRKTVGNHL
jgi:hypothetical protein